MNHLAAIISLTVSLMTCSVTIGMIALYVTATFYPVAQVVYTFEALFRIVYQAWLRDLFPVLYPSTVAITYYMITD